MKRWLYPLLAVFSLASNQSDFRYIKEASAQDAQKACINFTYKSRFKDLDHLLLNMQIVGRPGYESQRKIPAGKNTDSHDIEICDLIPDNIYKILVYECTNNKGVEKCAPPDGYFVSTAKNKK